MSLLQEFESHKRSIGKRRLRALDFYIENIHPELRYDQIIYNQERFEKFDEWYRETRNNVRCYNFGMKEVSEAVVKFTHERDWDQFHSPENLAKSIAIESGELLECFQWGKDFDKKDVCEELADVVNYCILLADKLNVDLTDIVMQKLAKNAEKYPVEKSKGKSTKYDKL